MRDGADRCRRASAASDPRAGPARPLRRPAARARAAPPRAPPRTPAAALAPGRRMAKPTTRCNAPPRERARRPQAGRRCLDDDSRNRGSPLRRRRPAPGTGRCPREHLSGEAPRSLAGAPRRLRRGRFRGWRALLQLQAALLERARRRHHSTLAIDRGQRARDLGGAGRLRQLGVSSSARSSARFQQSIAEVSMRPSRASWPAMRQASIARTSIFASSARRPAAA